MRVRSPRLRHAAVLLGGLLAVAATVAIFRTIPGIVPTTVGLTLLRRGARHRDAWTVVDRHHRRNRRDTGASISISSSRSARSRSPILTSGLRWSSSLVVRHCQPLVRRCASARPGRDRSAERSDPAFRPHSRCAADDRTTGAIDVLARHVARRFELSRVAVCLPNRDGWRVHQGGREEVLVDADVLNSALAKAQARAGVRCAAARVRRPSAPRCCDPGPCRSCRSGTARSRLALLAAVSAALDLGTLDAIAGVVAIAIERTQFLTEREAAELVRQKADLAATLLASLSHDLKTPLTAIRVAVENLRGDLPVRRTPGTNERRDYGVERLTRLFQDILDMARIDAAAIHVEPSVGHASRCRGCSGRARPPCTQWPLHPGRRRRRHAGGRGPSCRISRLSHLLENAALYSHPPIATLTLTHTPNRTAYMWPSPIMVLAWIRLSSSICSSDSTADGKHGNSRPGPAWGSRSTRGLLAAVRGRVWAENAADAGARFTMLVPGARRRVGIH